MSLLGSFFGNTQRNDLASANQQAQADIQAAIAQSNNTRRDYLDQSLDYLSGGRQAQNVLLDALGVNGQGAQQQFTNELFTPGFDEELQFGIDQIDQSAAARGGLFSGATLKDVSDYGTRLKRGAFDNRINQLFQLQGNAPQMSAQLTQNTGDAIAATQFGGGQLQANNATNFGNAMAQSRSIPINNLLSLGTAGARIAGGF